MSTDKSFSEVLDELSKQVWNVSLDEFDILKEKCTRLSTQIAVFHSLQKSISHILSKQSTPLPHSQTRIGKFLESLYGSQGVSSSEIELRWQQLRKLDYHTFLLIAVSYSPLEISKMGRVEFEYLIQNTADYANSKDLPSSWIFRKEIQLAIAEKSDLENIRLFKKRYHDLEFSLDNACNGPSRKRLHEDRTSDGTVQNNSESLPSPPAIKTRDPKELRRSRTKRKSGPSLKHLQVNDNRLQQESSGDDINTEEVSRSIARSVPSVSVHHSVLDLSISDLVNFLGEFRDSCPKLNMICPYMGIPLPFIEIPLKPSDQKTARIEFSLQSGKAIVQYVLGSRVSTTNVSH